MIVTAMEDARRRHRAAALFCIVTVLFLVVRDLGLPEARDTEVWLGFELRDAAARWTAPLHWALYASAAWAFWTEKSWVWRAAQGYAVLIAVSHVVWNLTSRHGGGALDALWQGALFLLPVVLIGWLRPPSGSDEAGAH